MPTTHILVANAQLQPFETAHTATNPHQTMGHWQPTAELRLAEHSLSEPIELAHATAMGLPNQDGRIPWAAYESQTLQQACAWLHWCHLDVGMTDMVMQRSDALGITEAESQELYALIAPYFEQDGIRLGQSSPQRWLATGTPFADLACASLARVQGQSINAWLPNAGQFPQQTRLARLQAEVQMLLYSHPMNDARAQRGLPAINSFWLDGAGTLESMPAPQTAVALDLRLQDALAQFGDTQSEHSGVYTQAWASLLAECAQQGEQAISVGNTLQVTLCGPVSAITLQARPRSLATRFLGILGRKPANNIRSLL